MRIGILTSGGDAPGMNTFIEGFVQATAQSSMEVIGIYRGYNGFFNKEYKQLTPQLIRGIYRQGGSFLLAGRCEAFYQEEARAEAVEEIMNLGLDVLLVVGGEGSLQGAGKLMEQGIKVMGIPGTIDNDVAGSDLSIGFYTGVETIMDSLDRIRDTAVSHDRTHVVEVMGREAGMLASFGGYAGFAEYILVPEKQLNLDWLINDLSKRRAEGFYDHLIVVAEGTGQTELVRERIVKELGIKATLTVLGQIQRGGKPTAMERMVARFFAKGALDCLRKGITNVLLGTQQGQLQATALADSRQVFLINIQNKYFLSNLG